MIVGIGCDIVEITRIKEFIEKQKKLIFLTEQEQAICKDFPIKRKAEWVAGRFAAKEALVKAMHTQASHHICDFEILSNPDGSPQCNIDGYTIHLSIAHENEYAIAYAFVEQ